MHLLSEAYPGVRTQPTLRSRQQVCPPACKPVLQLGPAAAVMSIFAAPSCPATLLWL